MGTVIAELHPPDLSWFYHLQQATLRFFTQREGRQVRAPASRNHLVGSGSFPALLLCDSDRALRYFREGYYYMPLEGGRR